VTDHPYRPLVVQAEGRIARRKLPPPRHDLPFLLSYANDPAMFIAQETTWASQYTMERDFPGDQTALHLFAEDRVATVVVCGKAMALMGYRPVLDGLAEDLARADAALFHAEALAPLLGGR